MSLDVKQNTQFKFLLERKKKKKKKNPFILIETDKIKLINACKIRQLLTILYVLLP